MKHFFYPRLALTNIKKNKQIYFPYLMTSSFTVMMFYLIYGLSINKGIVESRVAGKTLPVILELGTHVVLIFSFIFLFYINSFMMKRRKKEFALYNILGMEKKHVMFILFYETLLTTLISLVVGVGFGAIFSQLMFLILVKLAQFQTTVDFAFSWSAIYVTLKVFVPIFTLSYLFNVLQIKLAKPIELLRGGEVGEKEPKVKWLYTLVGFVCLGIGYYLAQTIEDPILALVTFFVAVVLVIIGTYSLFTSGSIMILKMLKKNKRYYYQTRHFTSVSQMIYRMKQNAVGLASICILCTCILVMLSSTISLYLSIEDTVHLALKEDAIAIINDSERQTLSYGEMTQINQKFINQLKSEGIELDNILLKRIYSQTAYYENGMLMAGDGFNQESKVKLVSMSVDDYNRTYHKNVTLKNNEVLLYQNFLDDNETLTINNQVFQVKGIINDQYFMEDTSYVLPQDREMGIVFNSEKTLKNVTTTPGVGDRVDYAVSIDYQKGVDEKRANEIFNEYFERVGFEDEELYIFRNSQYEIREMYTDMFGSLFFLGIFLGTLFLMAAILIMYYKQLSEGYEDQKRYEIMQNVGMSQKEVKQSIRSQVLIFFFLPLIVAVIHMAFAFKMITKMFSAIVLSELSLFVWCTVIAVVILVIIYSIIYSFTARTYYRIVQH